jgi:hypothetical protein
MSADCKVPPAAEVLSMHTAMPSNSELWTTARRVYPLYQTLAREFMIEAPNCRELEEALDHPPAEAVAAAQHWFAQMDQRVQIHQLRQFAQTSPLMTEEMLRELLVHYLHKKPRTADDRDKLDFLLVQYFSQRVSAEMTGPDIGLQESAKLLEPVLGVFEISTPHWLAPLEDLLGQSVRAKTLNELFTLRIIEQGRHIKSSCGEQFFEPAAMVGFARFGFLVRRAFFRLMHQDLNAILDGLRELEAQGMITLDCRKAQFSAEEPIARLRLICQSWKVMFQAEYSAGQALCILVDLRTAVESAMLHRDRLSGGKPRAKAAAAGHNGGKEFEVSGPETWSYDGSGG